MVGLLANPSQTAGGGDDNYVVFANFSLAVDLAGWTVRTSAGDVYEFGHVVIDAGSAIRLHLGEGTDGPADLYWGPKIYASASEGFALLLRDATGFVIDTYSVPSE